MFCGVCVRVKKTTTFDRQDGEEKKQKMNTRERRKTTKKDEGIFSDKIMGPHEKKRSSIINDFALLRHRLRRENTRPHHGGQRRRNEELFVGQVDEEQEQQQEKVLRGREWTKTRRVRNLGRVQKASVLVPERAAQGILPPRLFVLPPSLSAALLLKNLSNLT